MNGSTEASPKPWSGLGYEQVPGLANRLIARYLRLQRRNMRRFFTERGLLELTERMDIIRKSRQGMMAKNQMFRGVLDEYAKLVTPTGTAPVAGAETNTPQDAGSEPLAVQPAGQPADGECGPGVNDGVGVHGLGEADGEVVVEE